MSKKLSNLIFEKANGSKSVPHVIHPIFAGQHMPAEHLAYINSKEAQMLRTRTDGKSDTTQWGPQSFTDPSQTQGNTLRSTPTRTTSQSRSGQSNNTGSSGGGYSSFNQGTNLSSADRAASSNGAVRNQSNGSFGGGSVQGYNGGGGGGYRGGQSTFNQGTTFSAADRAASANGAVRNQSNGSFGGGSVQGYNNGGGGGYSTHYMTTPNRDQHQISFFSPRSPARMALNDASYNVAHGFSGSIPSNNDITVASVPAVPHSSNRANGYGQDPSGRGTIGMQQGSNNFNSQVQDAQFADPVTLDPDRNQRIAGYQYAIDASASPPPIHGMTGGLGVAPYGHADAQGQSIRDVANIDGITGGAWASPQVASAAPADDGHSQYHQGPSYTYNPETGGNYTVGDRNNPNRIANPNPFRNALSPNGQTLFEAQRQAALDSGMSVRAFSGRAGRASGTKNHPAGNAIDVSVMGPNGKYMPNNKSASSYRNYEKFAQATKQELDASGYKGPSRWGGYFSYNGGFPADLMHMDVTPGGATAGGSWAHGATRQQLANLDGAYSVGMGDSAGAANISPAAGNPEPAQHKSVYSVLHDYLNRGIDPKNKPFHINPAGDTGVASAAPALNSNDYVQQYKAHQNISPIAASNPFAGIDPNSQDYRDTYNQVNEDGANSGQVVATNLFGKTPIGAAILAGSRYIDRKRGGFYGGGGGIFGGGKGGNAMASNTFHSGGNQGQSAAALDSIIKGATAVPVTAPNTAIASNVNPVSTATQGPVGPAYSLSTAHGNYVIDSRGNYFMMDATGRKYIPVAPPQGVA